MQFFLCVPREGKWNATWWNHNSMFATIPYSNLAWHSLAITLKRKQTDLFSSWATKPKENKRIDIVHQGGKNVARNIRSLTIKKNPIILLFLNSHRTGSRNSTEGTHIDSSPGFPFNKQVMLLTGNLWRHMTWFLENTVYKENLRWEGNQYAIKYLSDTSAIAIGDFIWTLIF